MKVLTVRQPWAQRLVTGDKRIENRSRTTTHRGLLVIHAGSTRRHLATGAYATLPFGALVGLVEIVDALPLSRLPDELRTVDAIGPWCWIVANPRAFVRPIPCAGALAFWAVNDDIVTRELLRDAPEDVDETDRGMSAEDAERAYGPHHRLARGAWGGRR
jgi:hypothetical protein